MILFDNKIHYLIAFAMFAGRPGTDYPILSAVPYTNFYCDEQLYPGFFADMETRCQGACCLQNVLFWFLSDLLINWLLISFSLLFVISLPGWHYCGKNFTHNALVPNQWHLILDIDGRQATFLCPNGTQFSQAVFVCDWWFNVRCDLSPRLYAINARLYQRPKVNPTKPHRIITKELVEDIFNK